MERKAIEISWRSLWRVLFFLALGALVFAGIKVLLALFLAIVISSGLEFIVNFLERRGLPRTLGVILVFLFAVILFIAVFSVVVPVLVVDINTILNTTIKGLSRDPFWGPVIGLKAAETANMWLARISDVLWRGGAGPFGVISEIFGGLVLAFSVVVISFYLSLSRDGVERFLRAVLPADYEETALKIYERSRRRIGLWFRSQIILSLIVGFMVFVVLSILGVKYTALLALLAGVFELLPYIGPTLAGSASVLTALLSSPLLAFYTLIAFVVIQQMENHVLVPLIVGRSVGLHPVIVIVSLLIGGQVGGFLGILVAVPAAVVLQEVVEDWAGKKRFTSVPLP
jgi:predicted PurR-regulated permease PerM